MSKDMATDRAPRANCVGIIMDGNRRWAREQGMVNMQGHAAGYGKAKDIVRHAFSRGVGTVILYVFSTENWNRSQEEVGYLMDLLAGAFMRELKEFSREGVRVRFIGDLGRLPEKIQASIRHIEEKSVGSDAQQTLGIAISYGGRAEILSAVQILVAEGKNHPTEEDFTQKLWSHDMPDPDIVIRTGGEKRLSNFLPWQSVYSELFFTDTKWPAFTKEEFDGILAEFPARKRRRGK